ncbi:uncharacterized protein LOC119610070 [Lucilia sericata]|uniref:uncharacterized protein LOC119610070 n=1 Tax=Lucilia sericata TaxID=13632 RepID=UPI0018A85C4B|nr:uncharacterized protein LOC119610070 [Lucilia sericata]
MPELLINSINKRKSKLFDIDLFNAAIYLDPRIKICLDSEYKENAKKYITSLYKRINSIKEITSEVVNQCVIDEESPSTSTKAKSLTEFLKKLDRDTSEEIKGSPEWQYSGLLVY